MQRIEFSELTNRLRRNLMAAAFLIIVIVGFNIRVGKVMASGFELENLTTEVVLIVLMAFVFYHAVTFAIHAWEEYRLWEIKLTEKQNVAWSGGIVVSGLAKQLGDFSSTLQKMKDAAQMRMDSSGDGVEVLTQDGENVLTKSEIGQLRNIVEATEKFAKRFDNFPGVTRTRFWVFDVGVAGVVTLVACSFGFGWIEPGVFSKLIGQ